MNSSTVANACLLCSSASNTTSTQGCSTSASITNGTRVSSGTQTCAGNFTGGTGGTTVGTSTCTGCSTWGTCNYTSYVCNCNSGYHSEGTGAACTCVADCSTSKACSTLGSEWSGTYNECTGNQSSQCYKSCSVNCSGNATSSCPANATCTYNTSYTYSGTQYYGGSCGATAGTCPVASFTCNTGYYKDGSTCKPCEDGYYCPGNDVRTACTTLGAGYTKSDGTRTANTDCYQSCSKACTQQTCPSTAYSCSHGSTSTSGTQHYNGTCTATASTCSLTVNSCKTNNYKDGNACKGCPSGYPYSANQNTGGITSCYSATKSRAWTGSQTACAKPDNCYSVTCNTCANPACDYVAYANTAGTGDGEIKSGCPSNGANCQQTVKSVTANANYYVNGTACSPCSGLTGGFGTSNANNSGGAGVCYKSCSVACTTQSCASNVESCTNGTDTKTGTQYYGGSCSATAVACPVTVNSCKAGNYKDGNACKSCPASHPGSAGANTGGIGTCYVSCGDIKITNGTDKADSATVYYSGACTYTRTCDSGYNLTSDNACAQLCTAGVTTLKLGSGVTVPLYSAKQTTRVIGIGIGNQVCYGSLATGAATGALNVTYDGATYHSIN